MTPKVIKTIAAMRRQSRQWQREGRSIAFVPTMGFLHEGHLSLIRKGRELADVSVVSIYVNPTQFAPGEDLDKYPRDFERDIRLCAEEQVDVVFFPSNEEMYPGGYQTFVLNESLSDKLCGRTRPTHFKGVTTIVAKLFNIVDADYALFGRKDAQQALIIRNMARDLNFRTEIIVAPIVREPDGLAMSSRNKYLSPAQRQQALVLNESLRRVEALWREGERDIDRLKKEMATAIESRPECRVDYISFVDADTLENAGDDSKKILLALAVFVGNTRLIDNTLLQR